MVVAARLAKLGNEVTLLEVSDSLGGALRPVEQDGFRWDGGPATTTLPAVLRDLFRKSGRPIEREAGDLEPVAVVREHRFLDGSSVRIPGGSRAAQIEAFETFGGSVAAERWIGYVGSFHGDWDDLRQGYLEVPRDLAPADLRRRVDARLARRVSLERRARALRDPRLRLAVTHRFAVAGHDPRRVPSWLGLLDFLEQRFGSWTVPDGMSRLRDLMAERLVTRKVEVRLGLAARDLVVRDGRVVAVATAAGELDANAVVVAIDPRRLPALAGFVAKTAPAIPPAVTHLGLAEAPELPHEVVLHGSSAADAVVLRIRDSAWTLLSRGPADPVAVLAARGLDVRDRVVARVDRSPSDIAAGGSPFGLQWAGRSTVARRLGPATPIPGVFLAGAHGTPGAGLPFVGLSAALVLQAMGYDTRA